MNPRERIETFEIIDGHLVHKVVPRRGRPYEHRCLFESFKQVAHAIDDAGDQSFTPLELAEREGLPSTQVAVALAFLRERGIVDVRYRRNFTSSRCAFEDAMVEYLAMDPAFETD